MFEGLKKRLEEKLAKAGLSATLKMMEDENWRKKVEIYRRRYREGDAASPERATPITYELRIKGKLAGGWNPDPEYVLEPETVLGDNDRHQVTDPLLREVIFSGLIKETREGLESDDFDFGLSKNEDGKRTIRAKTKGMGRS